ncbi:MAG: pilus assembly protein [Acidimicrobiia bacterium]|nr:pilus assembly protein [Acidimicrobiia bacterium]
MLEFALVIPIFIFVLYGLISFGMVLSAKQSIVHASAEGARASLGAVPLNGQSTSAAEQAAAQQQAQNSVRSALGANGQYAVVTVPPPTYCSGSSGPQCITVTVSYDYSSHPLIPPAPGLGLVMPSTISSTAVLQLPS